MLILLSAKIFDKSFIKPGLSWLVTYKLCSDKSASILIPLISTILALPPKIVPETERVCLSVTTVNFIND